jgi:hypothetical protein
MYLINGSMMRTVGAGLKWACGGAFLYPTSQPAPIISRELPRGPMYYCKRREALSVSEGRQLHGVADSPASPSLSFSFLALASEIWLQPSLGRGSGLGSFHNILVPISYSQWQWCLTIFVQSLFALEGIDLYSVDKEGQTLLSWAARYGHKEIVEMRRPPNS